MRHYQDFKLRKILPSISSKLWVTTLDWLIMEVIQLISCQHHFFSVAVLFTCLYFADTNIFFTNRSSVLSLQKTGWMPLQGWSPNLSFGSSFVLHLRFNVYLSCAQPNLSGAGLSHKLNDWWLNAGLAFEPIHFQIMQGLCFCVGWCVLSWYIRSFYGCSSHLVNSALWLNFYYKF